MMSLLFQHNTDKIKIHMVQLKLLVIKFREIIFQINLLRKIGEQ